MHDSEQEHSGITGCRVTYESTIFYNEANKFSIGIVNFVRVYVALRRHALIDSKHQKRCQEYCGSIHQQ